MARFSGFQCKQFFVAHDLCAMKVSTDALLLGSWAEATCAKRVLDIGTGSGILALMMAQKTPVDAHIDAIDIHAGAIAQAQRNVANSPWMEKVRVFKEDVQAYESDSRYDLIICNPPYFAGSGSIDTSSARQQARLDVTLSPLTLFHQVKKLLLPDGQFYCMYPMNRHQQIRQWLDAAGVYSHHELWVSAREGQPPYLVLFHAGLSQTSCNTTGLVIKDRTGHYTMAFKERCKAFYLHF